MAIDTTVGTFGDPRNLDYTIMFVAYTPSGWVRRNTSIVLDFMERVHEAAPDETARFWGVMEGGKIFRSRKWNQKNAEILASAIQDKLGLVHLKSGTYSSLQFCFDLNAEDWHLTPDVMAISITRSQLDLMGLQSAIDLYRELVSTMPIGYGFIHPVTFIENMNVMSSYGGTEFDRPVINKDSRIWISGRNHGNYERLIRGWYWGNLLTPRHMDLVGSLDSVGRIFPDFRLIDFPRGMTLLIVGDEPMVGVDEDFWTRREQLTAQHYPVMMKSQSDRMNEESKEDPSEGIFYTPENVGKKLARKAAIIAKNLQIYRQGIHLDFSEDSLKVIDMVIEDFYNDNLSYLRDIVVKEVGAYLGEILCRQLNGQWEWTKPREQPYVRFGDRIVRIILVAQERFVEPKQSLWDIYQAIKRELAEERTSKRGMKASASQDAQKYVTKRPKERVRRTSAKVVKEQPQPAAVKSKVEKVLDRVLDEKELAARIKFDEDVLALVKERLNGPLRQLRSNSDEDELVPVNGLAGPIPADVPDPFELASELNRKLQDKGYVAFVCTDDDMGLTLFIPQNLGVIKANDCYDVLRVMGTNGMSHGASTNAIIAKLKEWDEKYGIEIQGADWSWVWFKLKTVPDDKVQLRSLAKEIHRLCPSLVDEFLGSIAKLVLVIRSESVMLWWK